MNRKCNRCGARGDHMIWCPKRLASDAPVPKEPMTIDEALEETTWISAGSNISNTARAAVVLAAELRRLRAGVEKLGDKNQTYHHVYGDSVWVRVDDVLAALEGE